MKIFNWVHRKFNQKDGEKKNYGNVAIGNDHEMFLDVHNAFDDALDGWKGGILTIGTFGYHPLLKDDKKDDHQEQKEEEEESEKEQVVVSLDNYDENVNEEEVDHLVYAVYNAHDDEGSLFESKENCVSSKNEFEFEFELEFEHEKMMKNNEIVKKERTTLADLFSADLKDLHKKKLNNKKGDDLIFKEKMNNIYNNDNNNLKNGFNSFPKKLIGGEAGKPTHKLNRLMRRMLKRKIHPDFGLNKQVSDDSASLLPIQDVVI